MLPRRAPLDRPGLLPDPRNGLPVLRREARHTPETSLAAGHPQLLGEWAHDLNGTLDPATVRPNSSRRVWWRCTRDPAHVWQVRVADRASRSTGCPYCTRTRATTQTPPPAAHSQIAAD